MKKINLAKNISKILLKWLKIVSPCMGTSLPGAYMLKFHPDYIKNEVNNIEKGIIFITGTNGKTTSTGLLSSVLESSGAKILDNRNGANMPQGIATSFLKNDGNAVDYGVFEADEAWLGSLHKAMRANYLLVTNLFSDQIERFGGVYTLAKKINSAIISNSELKVVLNADDPHLLPLKNNNVVYFGIEKVENNIKDKNICPEICTCGNEYTYKSRYYAHLGKYFCKNCDNKRPEPDFSANVILNDDGIELTINDSMIFKSKLIGLYNAYNLLGVISLALSMDIDEDTIQKGIDTYKNVFARTDSFEQNGKQFFIQLIKNAAGATQCVKLLKNYQNAKLFLLLNDNSADGQDISWIYDADFDYFTNFQNEIILSGSRAKEIALRLKHIGLKEEKMYISENIGHAYSYATRRTERNETLCILGNYSALRELRKIMKR